MAKDKGLEELRTLFRDHRQHSAIGMITKLGALTDRSALRVKVKLFPDEREIVATMTWESVGPSSGDFDFPAVEDLVLVFMIDGDPDQAYVLKRLTSKVDKIPAAAMLGHQVRQAKAGKKTYLASDTRVVLGLPDSEGDEPLVLGNVMLDLMTEIFAQLDAVITAIKTKPIVICGPPGGPGLIHPLLQTEINLVKAALDSAKSTYVTTGATNFVSSLVYTERGGI